MSDQNNSRIVFIQKIDSYLKKHDYSKSKSYWYKAQGDYYLCIHVQGSSWSKDDYYVNIGISQNLESCPNELRWKWWHRCKNEHGNELKLPLQSVILCMNRYFGDFSSMPGLSFYKKYHSVLVNGRYIVLEE
ncbi:MAG: DUF4304 domain-containing protein [Clostridia bacterium]|nr:DUF4304 domain-containing protein [Clostridia bacterium]